MEFYEVINNRRSIRDFKEKEIPDEVLERILDAGIKAPSGTPIREIEFVVIKGKTTLLSALLEEVKKNADHLLKMVKDSSMTEVQQAMYRKEIPKQYKMLSGSGTLILPFYKQKGDLFQPTTLSSLNAFASVWCCIENILLAAVAEGLAGSIRVPVGEEHLRVAKLVDVPAGYVLPCFLGIGYPVDNPEVAPPPDIVIRKKIHLEKW